MGISILLVEPENPDNVGAVARAMKNMGLKDLRLVKPVAEWQSLGKKMAVSAADILESAREYASVSEAVADLSLVIGTTRRGGPKRGAFAAFDQVIEKIKKSSALHQAGIMFGKESKGLDNDALRYCDWLTAIPVHPDYPSINLAQAVMILAFSLFDKSTRLPPTKPKRGRPLPNATNIMYDELHYLPKEEMQKVLHCFEEALEKLGYAEQGDKLPRIRSTLERLFKRTGLLASEAEMFKGLTRRICDQAEGKKRSSHRISVKK